MATQVLNIFQGKQISFSKKYATECEGYVARGSNVLDHSPFPRVVDIWFLAICIAIYKDLPAEELPRETVNFIEGSIFAGDPWRVNLLILFAIGKTGSTDIVEDPNKLLKLANQLANAGAPEVFRMLKGNKNDTPIYSLCDQLKSLIDEQIKEVGGEGV